jgi:hypothetical protein
VSSLASGFQKEVKMAYCPRCGKPVGVRDMYCKNCGEKLQDRASGAYAGSEMILEDTLKKVRNQARDHTYTPLYREPKLVRTETVTCLEEEGEIHTAVVEFYEDDTRKVRCRGDCSDCPYGDVQ